MKRTICPALLGFMLAAGVFAQENKSAFLFIIPAGYGFASAGGQTVHSPTIGAAFFSEPPYAPFTEVGRRVIAAAMWRPFIFNEDPLPAVPAFLHETAGILDIRRERHQLLLLFRSFSDSPVSGGLNTFRAAAGWGYEVIRERRMSLIIGAGMAVGDFDIAGISAPVMPVPIARLRLDTEWFASSLDFFPNPDFNFTVAPRQRIRFTGSMGTEFDKLQRIGDIDSELTVWYRLFPAGHRLGDFIGAGAGFKNDMANFELSNGATFAARRTAVFAAIDLAPVRLQGGWIFSSENFFNGHSAGSPGRGAFFSVQGIIPVAGF